MCNQLRNLKCGLFYAHWVLWQVNLFTRLRSPLLHAPFILQNEIARRCCVTYLSLSLFTPEVAVEERVSEGGGSDIFMAVQW